MCVCVQADYEAKNYDVKKAGGYWQLGKMGAADTPEVQEKVPDLDSKPTKQVLQTKSNVSPIQKPAPQGCFAVSTMPHMLTSHQPSSGNCQQEE